MTESRDGNGYSHKQTAPLCLILYGLAIACFAQSWWIGNMAGLYITGGVGLLFVLLAPAFHFLAAEDQGGNLAIRFGPMPLFRRSVKYADMK